MSRAPQPSVCPGCNLTRLRGEYHTRSDGSRAKCCIYCGNKRASLIVYKTCVTCGETKHRANGFTKLKRKPQYQDDCKVCRAKAVEAARAAKIERLEQRKKVRTDPAQKLCAEPTNTTNPFEWRTYVQPFQPPPEKWSNPNKTTPTKEQHLLL